MTTNAIIFISRDCLNAGITEGTVMSDYGDGRVFVTAGCVYRPGEWHRTRPDAIARAESMRVAELERARAYVTKLEQLRFE